MRNCLFPIILEEINLGVTPGKSVLGFYSSVECSHRLEFSKTSWCCSSVAGNRPSGPQPSLGLLLALQGPVFAVGSWLFA